jgi:hypothetical protein
MFDRYGLIRFNNYEDASDYCKRLPKHSRPKVHPIMWGIQPMFSVTVSRDYTDGRL